MAFRLLFLLLFLFRFPIFESSSVEQLSSGGSTSLALT